MHSFCFYILKREETDNKRVNERKREREREREKESEGGQDETPD